MRDEAILQHLFIYWYFQAMDNKVRATVVLLEGINMESRVEGLVEMRVQF